MISWPDGYKVCQPIVIVAILETANGQQELESTLSKLRADQVGKFEKKLFYFVKYK